MLPEHLRPLFWDVDVTAFSPHAYPEYTIARVLELGDTDAVRWLRAQFDEQTIVRVIRTDRRLSPRSANFWALRYRIPREEVAALR